MCVGDWIQKIIHFVTMGFGKPIAQKIAEYLGFESCGCSERQERINGFFGCEKDIEL